MHRVLPKININTTRDELASQLRELEIDSVVMFDGANFEVSYEGNTVIFDSKGNLVARRVTESCGLSNTTNYHKKLNPQFMPYDVIFDTSGDKYKTPENCPNHNGTWDTKTLETLIDLMRDGCSLQELCKHMGRTRGSIISRLQTMGFIEPVNSSVQGYYGPWKYTSSALIRINKSKLPKANMASTGPTFIKSSTEQNYISQPKETTMTTIIETRTFIQGTDAANLSDDAIFNLIHKLEGEVAGLRVIKTQPKKLAAKIAKMEEDIKALSDYVDGR